MADRKDLHISGYEDQPDDPFTNQEIYDKLREYAKLDIILYVLPTMPLGEEWVLGLEGLGIHKLHGKAEATAFIIGANAVAARFARSAGF